MKTQVQLRGLESPAFLEAIARALLDLKEQVTKLESRQDIPRSQPSTTTTCGLRPSPFLLTAGGEKGARDVTACFFPPARIVQPQYHPSRTNGRLVRLLTDHGSRCRPRQHGVATCTLSRVQWNSYLSARLPVQFEDCG